MITDINKILTWFSSGRLKQDEALCKILSLMGEKEIGVLSTSNTKDGVSHIVRDSHASELEVTKEVRSNGSLEKITNTENNNFHCDWKENGYKEKCKIECDWCKHWNSMEIL